MAPKKKQIPAAEINPESGVITPWKNKPSFPKISTKSHVPNGLKKISKPIKKTKSPILFIKKAFLFACTAYSLVNQNPINKYEAKPTNSQKIYIISRFLEMVKPNIAKQNKLKYIQYRCIPASPFI